MVFVVQQDVVGDFADAAFKLNVSLCLFGTLGLWAMALSIFASMYVPYSLSSSQGWRDSHVSWFMAIALQVGEMTDAPVKTRFGYHIILVEGRK